MRALIVHSICHVWAVCKAVFMILLNLWEVAGSYRAGASSNNRPTDYSSPASYHSRQLDVLIPLRLHSNSSRTALDTPPETPTIQPVRGPYFCRRIGRRVREFDYDDIYANMKYRRLSCDSTSCRGLPNRCREACRSP